MVRWSTSGVELDKMHMSLDQKFRARLCLECYRLFTENPAVPVRTIVKNIAQRDYRMLTENARLTRGLSRCAQRRTCRTTSGW